jgi:hypothetical protein
MGKFIDLTGKKIGDWIVEGRESNAKNKHLRWRVKCKCGNTIILGGPYLKNGWDQKDCGCSKSIVGRKYGKLTILNKIKRKDQRKHDYECLCECGRTKIFKGYYILSGRIKSCGCLLSKTSDEIGPKTVYNHYKQASKKRKILFSLNKKEFKDLIESKCFYCDCLDSNIFQIRKVKNYEERFYKYNGIDRKDSAIGYTTENSVPCCRICNLMKRGLSIKEWFDQIRKILSKQQNAQLSA